VFVPCPGPWHVVWLVLVLAFISGVPRANGYPPLEDDGSYPVIRSVLSCPICHQSNGRIVDGDVPKGKKCVGCHTPDGSAVPLRVAARAHPSNGHAQRVRTAGMVNIPGGPFIIGYDNRHPDEKPAHTISLPAFQIDTYEVTNGQYKLFVDATNRRLPDDWENGTYPPGKRSHPVVFVTWNDAHDFCVWAGKRLPTEEEWEKAARGTDGRLYPWGNEFDPRKANMPQSHSVGTMPVGSFPQGRSPYGVYDMAGNVWEWTDSWAKPYPGSPIPTAHYFTGEYKVLRGGSWVDCSFYRCGISALTFNRGYFKPTTKNQGFGFRCAKDAEP